MKNSKEVGLSNLYIVLDNIRSCYNVGAIMRSMGFFGFNSLIAIGSTPYPQIKKDIRPRYIIDKNTQQIAKTALGAEKYIDVFYYEFDHEFYHSLESNDILISLEQDSKAIYMHDIVTIDWPRKTYIVLGSEDKGVSPYLLEKSNSIVEITGLGQKESLNVSSAAAMALFYINILRTKAKYEN